MTFAARLTRCPRPYDPDRGADAVALMPDAPPEVAELLRGAGGCSPYLLGLLQKEADWFASALDDPEVALEAMLLAAAGLPLDQLSSGLRQAKRRVALLAGMADLGGVWQLEQVTGALSRLADVAVDVSIRRLAEAEIARGKLPGQTEADAETAGGMVSLAMGKGGAMELNYSSDIDLICLFDETRFAPEDYHDARAAFIRMTRRMCAIIGEQTAEGYVFRTDLRLRPDPSVTPVCLSMEAAERYYESVGRTWERAAYIKARSASGDVAAGERFLKTLSPFVWRKHLDFAAIQDAHDMRLRIREHKGLGGPITLPGHNMKLGRGGIREIEFFTQTRQIIAGGRDERLRDRATLPALAALAAAGWVQPEDAETLTDHYRAHREVEHRLQMLRDAQTHDLPTQEPDFERLAAFCGTDVETLKADLRARLEEVHTLTEGFFAPTEPTAAPPDFGEDITARWPTYPALRSDRAIEIFNRLKPDLMARLNEAARPDEALTAFDGFLQGLPAGVQLFSLFEANPSLTRLIAEISASAPALAQYLGRNAGVLDAVIGGDFFSDWPGRDQLRDGLTDVLNAAPDYEARLDSARRWMKEWHFRIGVHHLQGIVDAEDAGTQYADLAGAVLAALYPVVVEEFSRRHGSPPGRGAVVLGMGSLGAERLHALSDLDVIVLYDGGGVEASDGKRPLATRPYYAKLTQALITALTAQTAEGRLYEVDMRLRPSGRQGPVATALPGFEIYQMEEAWTWEHLALTRARPIAGEPDLAAEVETIRARVLLAKGKVSSVEADLSDMRARIAAAKVGGPWDAKIGPGRLQDVELVAQGLALRAGSVALGTADQLAAGKAAGLIDAHVMGALEVAAQLFWSLQAASRLLSDAPLDPDTIGEGGLRFLLRETGASDPQDLAARIADVSATAATAIDNLLKRRTA